MPPARRSMAPAPGVPVPACMAELKQPASLRASGGLTPEEFGAEKQPILGL